MVIDDFNLIGMSVPTLETDPPLIVDAETVLSTPVAGQGFQTMGRRDTQIIQGDRRIEPFKTHLRSAMNVLRDTAGCLSTCKFSGFLVPEALDHGGIITPIDNNVKRYYLSMGRSR